MKPPTEKASAPTTKTPNFLPRTAEVIVVDERVSFDGNIIPHTWLHRITTENGQADVIACMVLAEIVYWYRGADVISGGQIVERKRKFDGDYLQKSYADLAEKLNLSKGQVSAAVIRLEKKNLIKREFRTLNIRGVKMSNILFIRLFAWQVVKISNLSAETTAEPADKSGPEGYGKESGDLPQILDGGHLGASDTSVGPVADKYKEYIRNYTPEYVPGKERSTSAEPAKPAPPELSSILENQTSALSTEPGSVQSTNTETTDVENPEKPYDIRLDKDTGVDNARRIYLVLEDAFNGQKFFGREEAALQTYITEGRITVAWAEAFSAAKMAFDQNREHYKTRKIYIPYKPTYLIRNFDLTSQGVVSILAELHKGLESANTLLNEETIEPFLSIIAAYDRYFEKEGYFNREYRDAILRAGCDNELDRVIRRPERFPYHDEGGAIPPAWMRLQFAHRKGVSTQGLRDALLGEAQEELRLDPGCAKLLPEPLSGEDYHAIFDLDYSALWEKWRCEYEDRDKKLERLETSINAVQEAMYASGLSNF